jgi:hypothetical protein
MRVSPRLEVIAEGVKGEAERKMKRRIGETENRRNGDGTPKEKRLEDE